ncbi:MAG: ATP-binding protein [Cyanobacteria bacterium P01_F01_bin.150]
MKAEIKLAMSLDPPAYIVGDINLYSVLSLRATYLSITHGNISESAKAYANYGLLLGLLEQKYKRGYEFADMGVQLAQKLNSKSQECTAGLLRGYWIHVWARHINGAAEVNYRSFVAGMDSGEIQFAAYNLFAVVFNRLFQGENLFDIGADIEKYWLISDKLKDDLLRISLAGCHIFIRQLSVEPDAEDSNALIANPEQIIYEGEVANFWTAVSAYYILRMHLACLTGQFDQGLDYIRKAEKVLNGSSGSTIYSAYFYYASLILLNVQSHLSPAEQHEAWEKISANQKQLGIWAESCPENFLHKYLLVEAERYRCLGQNKEAFDLYDQAIAQAKANQYVHEEALANELAAKFYLDWNKAKIAGVYLQEAYYCYVRWGATSKVVNLEIRYPELLRPILQPSPTLSNKPKTLGIPPNSATLVYAGTLYSSSSSSINQTLDFSSALRASQLLSGAIHLDALLEQLTQVILQNSGGDRCALIMPPREAQDMDSSWEVRAIAELSSISSRKVAERLRPYGDTGAGFRPERVQSQTTTLCSERLATHPDLPVQLIQYVKRTGKTFVSNSVPDTANSELPVVDEYLNQHQPKSVLCLPLIQQNTLVGIMYVQNQMTQGVFTDERLSLLTVLSTQAAISLENATLYHRLEGYNQRLEEQVTERTQELQANNVQLQQTLHQLQQTQAHLIQTERLSALGKMVSGIAHEINNPNNFIHGNLGYARRYFQNLFELIDLYEDPSVNTNTLAAKREEIDLVFLHKDVDKLLSSMEKGSCRIKGIVDDLQCFSGLDEAEHKNVNLHKRLDSTVLMVSHQLKLNDGVRKIKIIKDYGNIPSIHCSPSALNQAFFNIISNAIDALTEADDISNPTITIRTSQPDSQTLQIKIIDNGPGIAKSIQNQIFTPFFTTKDVGKGTGLGLAIAHRIVVATHGGRLEMQSEIGQGTEFCICLPTGHFNPHGLSRT